MSKPEFQNITPEGQQELKQLRDQVGKNELRIRTLFPKVVRHEITGMDDEDLDFIKKGFEQDPEHFTIGTAL